MVLDGGGGSSSSTTTDSGNGDSGTCDDGSENGGNSDLNTFSKNSCNTSTTNCNVSGADPQSVNICPDSLTIGKGGNQKFTLIGTYANSCRLDLTSFAWWESSDNSSFVNDNGAATFTAIGL